MNRIDWLCLPEFSYNAVLSFEKRLPAQPDKPSASPACLGFVALLTAVVHCGPVHAEMSEAEYFEEVPIVLSASRLSQPIHEAPAAVTLIDQQMIRASGFRDIPDLLRLVPGFSVAYTRNNTWAAGYHGLGDAFSRRFQVLVDGRSIYSPHYGAVHWSELPLSVEDIERIEVVRGPAAAIYGANAFAAVINIITKTGAQASGESVSVQLGEQDMRGLTVRHGGETDTLHYRFTASAQQRDRFERDITQKTVTSGDNGQYFEASKTYFVNGRFDWQLTDNSDVMGQFGLSQGDWHAGRRVHNPASVVEPLLQDSRALYLQLAYHKVESARREWRVQFYHNQNRFDAVVKADVAPLGGEVASLDQYRLETRSSVDLQVNEQWTPNLRAVWGGEIWQETVKSPQNYNSSKTLRGEIARGFGNIEWRPQERLLLHIGAMLEHHYYTDTDISPRAAINFTLTPGTAIRLAVSRAYRSPTFFEEQGNQRDILATSASLDTATVPSGGLAPERVLSREIAYLGLWRPARLEFDIRLFQDKTDHFIGPQKKDYFNDVGSLRPNEFKYANIGSVDSRGGEIQLRWRPTPALDVNAHYARVFLNADTTVNNFNQDIPSSAPRTSWGLLVDYRLGKGWQASVGGWRSDSMKWLTEGDLTPAFTRIDMRLARQWKWQGRTIEASVVAQNLGNDYSEFRDTNIFSRRVYGSLSLNW